MGTSYLVDPKETPHGPLEVPDPHFGNEPWTTLEPSRTLLLWSSPDHSLGTSNGPPRNPSGIKGGPRPPAIQGVPDLQFGNKQWTPGNPSGTTGGPRPPAIPSYSGGPRPPAIQGVTDPQFGNQQWTPANPSGTTGVPDPQFRNQQWTPGSGYMEM